MSLSELLPSVQSLARDDKVRLIRLLANELRESGADFPLEIGGDYPVWSPYEAHEAAWALQAILAADQSTL